VFDGPALWATADRFHADTDFYGGQVGLRGDYRRGPLSLEFMAKIALGGVAQKVDVKGSTILTRAELFPIGQEAGLLAVGPNSGTYTRNAWPICRKGRCDSATTCQTGRASTSATTFFT